MARKKRPEPHTQGELATLYKYFFGRFFHLKPDNQELRDFLDEVVFNLKTRDIVRYEARRDFTMPGLYYAASLVKIQGIGYRQVKAGTELFVRKDATTPEAIDVEFMGGQGGKDQVFCLTGSQWNSIAPHCREAERERKK